MAKNIGRKNLVETWNCGRRGDSNHRIFNTTYESIMYLDSIGKTDFFVVIQLTSNIRYRTIQF